MNVMIITKKNYIIILSKLNCSIEYEINIVEFIS